MLKLNIILGLNLPGIKPIIDSICQRYKAQTLLLYRQNENILRIFENWDEEIIINKRRIFFDNLYQYNNSTYYELLRNKIFLEVLHEENNNRNNENNKKKSII